MLMAQRKKPWVGIITLKISLIFHLLLFALGNVQHLRCNLKMRSMLLEWPRKRSAIKKCLLRFGGKKMV